MRVVSVAFPFARVSADAAGGAEQVLRELDRALCAAGWQSSVIAAAGSEVIGTLVPVAVDLDHEITDAARARTWRHVHDRVEQAGKAADVIHFHGLDFAAYLPQGGPPALATLHLPLHRYSDVFATSRAAPLWFNGVSATQIAGVHGEPRLLGHVANGVDLRTYAPVANPSRDYVLSLGRICPEKGFHLALDAARRAGVRMTLAGHVHPYADHLRYWEAEIRPRLDADRQRLPPVGPGEKRALLANARCLLVPSQIDETSSLVAMEAFACGTPVVAFRAGALPELVEHGVTGWLVDDVAAMATAIHDCAKLDARACRAAAERRFDARRMAREYLGLYRRIAGLDR